MRAVKYLLLSWLVAVPASASAAVDVTFVQPERYSDADFRGRYGAKASDLVLRDIRQHLEHLGERHLKPSQALKVEVLDIDLAGRFEPWRPFAYDVRIMRDITWPRIQVRYTLEENGQVLISAEESVADLNYLMNATTRLSQDRLRYEKTMLDDWFRTRFVKRQPPRS